MEPIAYLVSARLGADLGTALVLKGSFVVLVGLWLMYALRRRSAATRYAVSIAAFVGLLALPASSIGVPTWRLGVFEYPRETALVGMSSVEAGAMPESLFRNPETVVHVTEAAPQELPLASVFLLIWWTGVLIMSVRFAAGLIGIALVTRRGLSAEPESTPVRMAEAIRASLGVRRRVQLVYSHTLGVPLTWGIVRPTVILPPEAASWPNAHLHAVLMHELAHVKRWDFATYLLSRVVVALYWPNPLVWWMDRQIRAERESACDDVVLTHGTTCAAYAHCLLDVARSFDPAMPVPEGALAMARPSTLRRRIVSVMDTARDRRPAARPAVLLVSGLLLLLTLPMTRVGLWASSPGTGALDELVSALESEDPAVRIRAALALGSRGERNATMPLVTLLEDAQLEVRWTATFALGQIADPAAIEGLAAASNRDSEHWYVRKMAIESLGEIDDPLAADAVLPHLDSPHPGIRWLGVKALGKMVGQGERVSVFIEDVRANDPDERNRIMATDALAKLDCRDAPSAGSPH